MRVLQDPFGAGVAVFYFMAQRPLYLYALPRGSACIKTTPEPYIWPYILIVYLSIYTMTSYLLGSCYHCHSPANDDRYSRLVVINVILPRHTLCILLADLLKDLAK